MIQIKAKQQNVSFEKNVEKLAFVLSAHLYNTLGADKVIEEAAKRSGISEGVIKAAWDAAGEVIRTWATEGHNVPLPGLGSMRFGVRSKSVKSVEDVKTSLITARRVIFIPSKEVKDELQSTKIAITCYDKDGKIVKRVTSADTNDIHHVFIVSPLLTLFQHLLKQTFALCIFSQLEVVTSLITGQCQ